MADTAPLLAIGRFGSLVPVNDAARDAMKAVNGVQCRIEIKKSGANQRRRAFYWVMLSAAADALTDMTGQPWDSDLLHDELKRRLKLGVTFTTPPTTNDAIPAGMVRWDGGDSAPDDWQRGKPVRQRNGQNTVLDEGESGRLYSGWRSVGPYGIIAYTPKASAAPSAPATEAGEAA